MIISKKLDLCYRLSFGKMTKWLEGLTKGQAFALKCQNCKNPCEKCVLKHFLRLQKEHASIT